MCWAGLSGLARLEKVQDHQNGLQVGPQALLNRPLGLQVGLHVQLGLQLDFKWARTALQVLSKTSPDPPEPRKSVILQCKFIDFQIIDFCTPERDLGSNLSQVEAKLGQVGPKLSPSWAKLEPSWAQVAPS